MVNFVSAVEEDFLRFLGNREAVQPNFPLKKTKFYVDETKFSVDENQIFYHVHGWIYLIGFSVFQLLIILES